MLNGRSLSETISAVTPGQVALRSGALTLSYGELNARADSLAAKLAALGAGAGEAVAICLPRGFDQIVAELAAMRAGAAFVPVDPALPEERILHMLQDSRARVLVAPRQVAAKVGFAGTVLDVEADAAELFSGAAEKLPLRASADEELAYLIYTSGSTGVPKGVEITRANLDHLIRWHLEAFAITAADHATHLAGLGFDASVWEVWPYLAAGASLSLADDLTRVDPKLLQQWLITRGVTVSFVPTPVAEPLVALEWPEATKLRLLLTGGDRLHCAPRAGLPFALVNNYGPTECTVVATSGVVAAGAEGLPSIGKGITGTPIYVLDEAQQPVAAGTVGELYVGGGGVGRGYRNLPEQTAKSFVSDPFAGLPGARMYKTGDQGKLLPNGEIAFLGRLDTQEKIRGNRIELEEIVSVLARHEAITFSVVVTSTHTATEKHLIAYILLGQEAEPTAVELREFCGKSLPSYMIPARFVKLTALPLSTNGKTDIKLLPEPTEDNLLGEAASRGAESEIEIVVLDMVRQLLKTEDIGVEDDFFLVGGHSLLGTQLVMRARENFGVMLTLRDLFEAGTVAGLAARIEELILEEVNAMSEDEAERMASDQIG